jgi:hypothetical protein
MSNRRKQQILLGLLGAVLLVAVLGANAAVGADRTMLETDFVTESLEDEDLYETLAEEVVTDFQPAETPISASDGASGPPIEEMAESVVTPAYVQGEVERNVASMLGYLHGDREELQLAFDLKPIKSGFADEFEAWVLEADPGTFDPRMAALLESEAEFEDTRASFKQDQLERLQSRTDQELSRSELETLYDENRDRIRQSLRSQLEDSVAESGEPVRFQAALVDYGGVGIDALVAQQADYEQFRQDEAQAREELAAAAREAVRQSLDAELPDTMALTADLDPETRQTFETARTAVTTLDLLAIALPLIAILVAGLLGYVSSRRSNALWRVGGVVAGVGLLSVIATAVLSSVLPGLLRVDSGETPPQVEAALGVLRDALWTIGLQSAILLILGLALVGAGIGVRRELLPVEDEPEPTGESAETS